MISLAGRDILYSWTKYIFTGVGLGLLIGVTLSMAGIYRGMIDDARVLLRNSGADIWVVQKDTLGPYAESSSLRDDVYRSLQGLPGVHQAANATYLTMQVQYGGKDVRAMVAGFEPDQPGQPLFLSQGRHITRTHYEAVADVKTGFVSAISSRYAAMLPCRGAHGPLGFVGWRSHGVHPLEGRTGSAISQGQRRHCQ